MFSNAISLFLLCGFSLVSGSRTGESIFQNLKNAAKELKAGIKSSKLRVKQIEDYYSPTFWTTQSRIYESRLSHSIQPLKRESYLLMTPKKHIIAGESKGQVVTYNFTSISKIPKLQTL